MLYARVDVVILVGFLSDFFLLLGGFFDFVGVFDFAFDFDFFAADSFGSAVDVKADE